MGEFVDRKDELINVKKSNRSVDEDLELICSKKRKLNVELGKDYYDVVQLSENLVSSKCDESESINSNLMSPDLEDVHLEFEDFETEISNWLFRPTNEICVESKQGRLMCQSTTSFRKSQPTLSRPVMMPTEAELEEFFAAAEKSEQKRFAEKYNYDIVKDVPFEGKYEWVCLQVTTSIDENLL